MSPTEHEVMPSSSRILDLQTALFLLAALIFLYPFLFVPPFIPFNQGDNAIVLLNDGMRMYEGEVMYRDFFQFVTPGTPLVFFFLFKLFGLRPWIPNLLTLFLGLGLAWLGVVIAKKLMRPGLAVLPSAIFLVTVREFLCDPGHHWYSLLTATAAIAVLMERRTLARIAAAGFFCGLTACFTQNRGLGVIAGFGVFLWWESRLRQDGWRKLLRKQAWLVTSFLATLIAVNAFFVWKAGWARFLWCTVVFGLKYYPKAAAENTFQVFKESAPAFFPLGNFLHWNVQQWLFMYGVTTFIPILFFARYWRESGKNPPEFWVRPMLVAIVGSLMFLSVAPAPAYSRMAVSEFPALILLGWLIDSPRKLARALAAVFAVGILLVALHAVARRGPAPEWILSTPQGKLALGHYSVYQEYTWVQQHTQPSEYFYETGDAPKLYFDLDLRNPTPMPFLADSGYTTPEQVAEAIRGLEQYEVRYILLGSRGWLGTGHNAKDDHRGPLQDYVRRRYRLVKHFANYAEIWEKKD